MQPKYTDTQKKNIKKISASVDFYLSCCLKGKLKNLLIVAKKIQENNKKNIYLVLRVPCTLPYCTIFKCFEQNPRFYLCIT